ncbi:hypothetical protein [Streptosporangium sp. NPDC003464]
MITAVIMGLLFVFCVGTRSSVSLRPAGSELIPATTGEVAWAAFHKGSMAIRIRGELGVLFEDEDFAEAFRLAAACPVADTARAGVDIGKRWAYELDKSGAEIIKVQFARKDCAVSRPATMHPGRHSPPPDHSANPRVIRGATAGPHQQRQP